MAIFLSILLNSLAGRTHPCKRGFRKVTELAENVTLQELVN